MNPLTFLSDVEHECKIKSVLHSETSKYYSKINFWTCYPALIATTLCGSIYLTGDNVFNVSSTVLKIISVINIVACVILTVQNLVNFTKISDDHLQISREYSKLYREIVYFKKHSQDSYSPKTNFIEVLCDHVHFKLNIIMEVELNCPYSIMKNILNENTNVLTEKYFTAQTKFAKYTYTTKQVKKLYAMNRTQLMKLIVLGLKNNENKYPYMNFYDASPMQLMDFIVVELNMDPKEIDKVLNDKSDDFMSNRPPTIYVDNFVGIGDHLENFDEKSYSQSTSLNSDIEFAASCPNLSTISRPESDIASVASENDAYRRFRSELDMNIQRYYKKFEKCKCKDLMC